MDEKKLKWEELRSELETVKAELEAAKARFTEELAAARAEFAESKAIASGLRIMVLRERKNVLALRAAIQSTVKHLGELQEMED